MYTQMNQVMSKYPGTLGATDGLNKCRCPDFDIIFFLFYKMLSQNLQWVYLRFLATTYEFVISIKFQISQKVEMSQV